MKQIIVHQEKCTACRECELDLHEGASVAEVIARLGIPPDHAGMIISGDDQIEPTSLLYDGQEVNLFPPLAGGC